MIAPAIAAQGGSGHRQGMFNHDSAPGRNGVGSAWIMPAVGVLLVLGWGATAALVGGLVKLLLLVSVLSLGLMAAGGYAAVASGSQGSKGTGMWASIRRVWRYLGVKVRVLHDDLADPKVQLEQAIEDARAQHRRLTETAANVIANQRTIQQRLDRSPDQCDRAARRPRPGPPPRRPPAPRRRRPDRRRDTGTGCGVLRRASARPGEPDSGAAPGTASGQRRRGSGQGRRRPERGTTPPAVAGEGTAPLRPGSGPDAGADEPGVGAAVRRPRC